VVLLGKKEELQVEDPKLEDLTCSVRNLCAFLQVEFLDLMLDLELMDESALKEVFEIDPTIDNIAGELMAESTQKEEFVLYPTIVSTAGELMAESTQKEEFEDVPTIDSTAGDSMDESAKKEEFC
jgi:hypothetical protein